MELKGSNLTITANEISICYDDFGEGNIPIIFIHGFPFDKSMWEPQINFLKATHRVIAYDIRGYGKSSTGNEQLSIELFADDLIKLMEALQIGKATICGLSMGGYILLNAIKKYPDRFESIILADTQCIGDSAEAKEKRKKSISLIEEGGKSDFVKGFVNNIFCKETLNSNNQLVKKIEKLILSTSSKTITGTLNALAMRPDMCFSLNDISIPTLILCGKEDIVTPPAQSEFMYTNISGSILHFIKMAGHMSNLEQPELFNKHVANFVGMNLNRN
jgi:3-oxoadipate enol-lactonase